MSAAAGSGQLPLTLRQAPDQRFETFVGAPEAAIAQLAALAAGTAKDAVYLWGATGTGKTHLALATCAEAQAHGRRAAYLPLDSLAGRVTGVVESLEGQDLVVVEGLDAVAGTRDDEVALFDLHNRARSAGTGLLYTARSAPDALALALPDLRSRLAQCARIVLSPLDDAGRREMLSLRAARRGLTMDDAAIDWLLRRVDRDLSSLAALLDRLDRASLAAQRRVTVPFLRSTLGIDA